MSQIIPQTLNKDVFESSFTWNLKNFCAMIDEYLFNADLTTTKQIPISGIPFKWQLGMTLDKIYNYDEDDEDAYNFQCVVFEEGGRYGGTQAVLFKLDFIGDGSVPEKYTKIMCDFEIGSYLTGKVDLFPTKTDQVSLKVARYDLNKAVDRKGALVLNCRMKVTAYFIEGKPYELAIEDPRSCLVKLSNDMGNLLMNEDLSDLTVVAQDQELKVHKLILAARSPVFSLMLATEMKEKLESRIEFPDVSAEAAKEFVKFLYTGEVSITRDLNDLLSLAALYQIEDLKKACERMLVTQLVKENALENLFMANLHKCEELKMKSFKLITQHVLVVSIPDHLMNKPEAIEKLMVAKSKYDDTLKELQEAKKD